MESEHSNYRSILLSQRPKLSAVQILQSRVSKGSQRSAKSQRSKLMFELRNLRFDAEHLESKTASSNNLQMENRDYITQMQSLLTLYGQNLKEVERFVERNNGMTKEQSKSQPQNVLVNFERRKNITNRAIGKPESLPNIQLTANNGRKSISNGFEQPAIVNNPYKFELLFDGKNVMVTNFEMNMKTNIYTLPDFFEKLEYYYNKFCETSEKDPTEITEKFKALLNFDQNPHRELIERVFFLSKKFIRKSISKQFLMAVMSQRQTNTTQKKIFGRFIRNQKEKATLTSGMSLVETSKSGGKQSNNDQEYSRKASMFDWVGQPRPQFAPRGSNLSIKQNESSSPLNSELEFLRVMYFVLIKLLKHFFKTKFRNIQKLSRAFSEVDVKLHKLTHLDIGFNPFLDSEQVSRFAKQRKTVEKIHKENMRDLSRNSIAKCLTKHGYLSQDSAFAYLKNIRKCVDKA